MYLLGIVWDSSLNFYYTWGVGRPNKRTLLLRRREPNKLIDKTIKSSVQMDEEKAYPSSLFSKEESVYPPIPLNGKLLTTLIKKFPELLPGDALSQLI